MHVMSTEEGRAVMQTPEAADSQGIHHGSEIETQEQHPPTDDLLRGSLLTSPFVMQQALAQVTYRRPRLSLTTTADVAMEVPLSPRIMMARIQEEINLQNMMQQLEEAKQRNSAATLANLNTERALRDAREHPSRHVSPRREPSPPFPDVLINPLVESSSPQRPLSPCDSVTAEAYQALIHRCHQNEAALEATQQELQAVRANGGDRSTAQVLATLVDLLKARPTEPKAFTANKAMASSTYSKFSGRSGQDILVYGREFEGWAKHNGVAPQHWTRELCLKLEGPAAQQYELQYGDLPAGSYPAFTTAIASLAEYFSLPYQGASKFLAFTACKRGAGTSGKEAILKVESAFQAMTASGTPAAMSQEEMMFYVLQNQLQAGELETFLINLSAQQDCSDTALRKLQSANLVTDSPDPLWKSVRATDSVQRRAIFKLRLFLIKEFMHRCPGTPGPADGGRPAGKAAVAVVESQPRRSVEPRDNVGADECRLEALYAARRDTTLQPPPQYFGPNAANLEANQAELDKRKLTQTCFACKQGVVNYSQHFLDCPRHGKGVSAEDRKADRVWGADLPGPTHGKEGIRKGGGHGPRH